MVIHLPIYYTIKKSKWKSQTLLCGLNVYRNLHFHFLTKMKHHFESLVIGQVGSQKFTKIHVSYKIYCRKICDGGNIRSVIEKYMLDGLVQAGVIKDDNVQYVVSDSAEYFGVKSDFRCEITIKEVQ